MWEVFVYGKFRFLLYRLETWGSDLSFLYELLVMDIYRLILTRLLIRDFGVVLRRIRLAWIVGLLWSAWSFFGVISGIWSLSVEGEEGLRLFVFVLVVLEVGVVALFSYLVFRRRRFGGVWLFLYFWFSRIFWIWVGLIGFSCFVELGRFMVIQVLPAYVFFQGMRGTLSYYYLVGSDGESKIVEE